MFRSSFVRTAVGAALLMLTGPLVGGCAQAPTSGGDAVPELDVVFADAFMMGAALNPDQFHERDSVGAAIVTTHFNTITPENVMKWELIHPEPGRYAFEEADRFVAFGEANDLFMVGHTLVWHSQTPAWVFEDAAGNPVSRDTLLARMRDHIHTVVGRYRGRVHAWDVVNEALNEDGTLRDSPWRRIIGDDYLVRAFEYAREADPDAELYYNDYSLENAPKRNGAVALIRTLQARGADVTGIGTQNHNKMDWPSVEQLDSTIAVFSELGIDVMITELDIDVLPRAMRHMGADVSQNVEMRAELDPYAGALPDSVQQALARRYADLFDVYLKHRDAITRVTFWGVRDGDSWLNYWPVRGRTNFPLLFDREGRPKPAFEAVVATARAGT